MIPSYFLKKMYIYWPICCLNSWIFILFNVITHFDPDLIWPPDAKSWLIWKDPDAGKDWGQEEKETTEEEMAGWHHRLDGHGFGWILGVGDGQGVLVCCSSWVAKTQTRLSDWTELKNLIWMVFLMITTILPNPLVLLTKLSVFNLKIIRCSFTFNILAKPI